MLSFVPIPEGTAPAPRGIAPARHADGAPAFARRLLLPVVEVHGRAGSLSDR